MGVGVEADEDDEELQLLAPPGATADARPRETGGGEWGDVDRQKRERRRRNLMLPLLSQVLAVLLTVASISVQSLANANLNFPGTMNSLTYGTLCLVYVPWRARAIFSGRRRGAEGPAGSILKGPLWQYCLLALCDVEANFIIVFAYSFTTITSVTLLDFSTIPFAMILTRVFLRTRYNSGHIVGAATCVFGLALLVLADATSGGASENAGSRPGLGDVMVVISAVLYSTSNVVEENLLSREGAARSEVLAVLPLLALPLCFMQAYAFEHRRWAELAAAGPVACWIIGYVGSIFMFYSIAPYVLREGGSAAFNLAMITSDLWSALAKVVMFGGFGTPTLALAFFVSLVLVALGLFWYATSGETTTGTADGADGNTRRNAEPKTSAYGSVPIRERADGGGDDESEEGDLPAGRAGGRETSMVRASAG